MSFKRVSEAVIRRIPRYYRHLVMLESQGVERISSERLAKQMNLNASQVRQDFNCFGGFGQQGYGYNVSTLISEIKKIMAIDRKHSIIIVGAGNIGHALTNFPGFNESGFEVKALFDINKELIGSSVNAPCWTLRIWTNISGRTPLTLALSRQGAPLLRRLRTGCAPPG